MRGEREDNCFLPGNLPLAHPIPVCLEISQAASCGHGYHWPLRQMLFLLLLSFGSLFNLGQFPHTHEILVTQLETQRFPCGAPASFSSSPRVSALMLSLLNPDSQLSTRLLLPAATSWKLAQGSKLQNHAGRAVPSPWGRLPCVT